MGEIPPSWVDMLWSRVWFLGNNRIMFSFAVISGIEWGTGDEKQKESVALYQLFMGELSAVCMISFSFKLLIWNVLEVREKKTIQYFTTFVSICFPSLLLWPSYLRYINLKWLQSSLKRNESSPEQP